ncbi:MAG TPA: gamma-glutamylcyclotransferase family protein [Thermoanaerobaculia bacterium]|nr:gamma-glutamylcyclotransferase family protein [Thermoanaerobaculia bacterium]
MPLLFSYGTLQDPQVQLSTVARLLHGDRDELVGYERSTVPIEDPEVVARLGRTHHANVTLNGNDDSRVAGTALHVTDDELARFDEFEAAFFYERITARLASGRETFVYVSRD